MAPPKKVKLPAEPTPTVMKAWCSAFLRNGYKAPAPLPAAPKRRAPTSPMTSRANPIQTPTPLSSKPKPKPKPAVPRKALRTASNPVRTPSF